MSLSVKAKPFIPTGIAPTPSEDTTNGDRSKLELIKENDDLRNQINTLNNNINEQEQRINSLVNECDVLIKSATFAQHTISRLQDTISRMQDSITAYEDDKNSSFQTIMKLKADLAHSRLLNKQTRTIANQYMKENQENEERHKV